MVCHGPELLEETLATRIQQIGPNYCLASSSGSIDLVHMPRCTSKVTPSGLAPREPRCTDTKILAKRNRRVHPRTVETYDRHSLHQQLFKRFLCFLRLLQVLHPEFVIGRFRLEKDRMDLIEILASKLPFEPSSDFCFCEIQMDVDPTFAALPQPWTQMSRRCIAPLLPWP